MVRFLASDGDQTIGMALLLQRMSLKGRTTDTLYARILPGADRDMDAWWSSIPAVRRIGRDSSRGYWRQTMVSKRFILDAVFRQPDAGQGPNGKGITDDRAFFEVSPYIQEQAERALERCSGAFARIEEISEYNAAKVLAAFGHQHVSESHFAGSTGYGYGDRGRETLDAVVAEILARRMH